MDISVVIPCHNAAPYLAQAIGSVLEQTEPPREIIVVDDASSDGSLDIALRFAERFGDRVRVHSHRARNASRTRNLGAAIATGAALHFLDADDVLAPHTLRGLAEGLRARPDAVVVCPWYRLEQVADRWVQRPPSCAPRRPGQDPLDAWLTGWYHPPVSVLWSRRAFERAGRWDELCTHNDDGDLMLRALTHGVPFVSVDEGAGYYRRLPQGSTSGQGGKSGQRATSHGLLERLRVTLKIATLLQDDHRLRAHRSALHQNLARIAADASRVHPELSTVALSLAHLHGPPLLARIADDIARGLYLRSRRVVRYSSARARAATGRVTRRSSPGDREVHFGHASAAEITAARATGTSPPTTAWTPPTISVIVAGGPVELVALTAALESIRQQTADDVEVIVVDRRPAPRGPVIEHESGVRYLSSPGASEAAARNHGLRAANGAFIAFAGPDGEPAPGVLTEQVEHLRRQSDAVGLLQRSATVSRASTERGSSECERPGADELAARLLALQWSFDVSTVLMRRSVVAAVGFFDEQLSLLACQDYWVRITRFFDIDSDAPQLLADAATTPVRPDIAFADRDRFYRRHAPELTRLRGSSTAVPMPWGRRPMALDARIDPTRIRRPLTLLRRLQ